MTELAKLPQKELKLLNKCYIDDSKTIISEYNNGYKVISKFTHNGAKFTECLFVLLETKFAKE